MTDVTETPERDRGLLGLVERLMRKSGDPDPAKPVSEIDADVKAGFDPVVVEDAPSASLEPQLSVEGTRNITRTELADIIQRALLATEGCPQNGFEVTVYGSRPWNAMLRITPAAGVLPDAKAWRARLQDMVQLLRDQYDVTE
jgi:hypothetical protein